MSIDHRRKEIIKLKLRERGYTLTKVANSLGISVASVSIVLSRFRKSKRIEMEVSRLLNIEHRDLFQDEDFWLENIINETEAKMKES